MKILILLGLTLSASQAFATKCVIVAEQENIFARMYGDKFYENTDYTEMQLKDCYSQAKSLHQYLSNEPQYGRTVMKFYANAGQGYYSIFPVRIVFED